MSGKSRAWLLVLSVVVLCCAALWGVIAYRFRPMMPAAMLQQLPTKDALVVAIDFAALRKLGVLQMLDGSQAGEDADYSKFVASTDFNYTQDLDYVLAAFGPRGKFILARARFDWSALRAYAKEQGGQCYNSLCEMQGSTPDRKISFLPLHSNLLAIAVSNEYDAATRMEEPSSADRAANVPVPDAAVWLYLPPAILKSTGDLPQGTVLFAKSVDEARSVTLGFAPEGDHIAAKLNVLCRNDRDALLTTAELTKVTEVLRSVIAHAGQRPNPRDWSGVLTSGKFQNKDSRVFGYWPIDKGFLENILRGQ